MPNTNVCAASKHFSTILLFEYHNIIPLQTLQTASFIKTNWQLQASCKPLPYLWMISITPLKFHIAELNCWISFTLNILQNSSLVFSGILLHHIIQNAPEIPLVWTGIFLSKLVASHLKKNGLFPNCQNQNSTII
jgi:hypothetical protein